MQKDSQWVWGTPQQQAFEKIKSVLTPALVLALYNPNQGHRSFSRWIFIWTGRSTLTEARRPDLETGNVHIQTTHLYGVQICANRERGLSPNLGM